MTIFPESVHVYLTTTYGPARSIDPLYGFSRARVWRVVFAHGSVIVKTTMRSNEFVFYESVAPTLYRANIPLPTLQWSAQIAQATWLVLEDIPHPFPRRRWRADPEQLAVLRRLHQLPAVSPLTSLELFTPQWTSQMTEKALLWFAPPTANDLYHQLDHIRVASRHLFTPQCYISGDPNPTNWGLRRDGTLVLFDWERFGRGTPSLDLAISIPGLGDPPTFEAVAVAYLGEEAHRQIKQLTRDIILAKVWSIIEFLSMFRQGDDVPSETMAYLQQHFPAWLNTIDSVHD